ncbi:MAG: hypothetical protein ACLPXW_12385 [Xanthobacteraceae bacterium]
MNEPPSPSNQQANGEITPPSEGLPAQPHQTGNPPNSDSGYKICQRWQEFWNAIKALSVDRKIELALVTAVFAATTVSVCVASLQWSAMTESNIASTRAWISPTGARFDGEPKAGFNVRVKIAYENVGKEAASDVVYLSRWSPEVYKVTIDAKQMPYIDIQTNPWPVNELCDIDASIYLNRRTVYPGAKNEFITYGFNNNVPPTFLPQEVIDGKDFFWIYGCIVYRSPITKQKIHHSPFCLYYQPKRGGTIKDGTFEFCPSGSANAD